MQQRVEHRKISAEKQDEVTFYGATTTSTHSQSSTSSLGANMGACTIFKIKL